MDVVVADTSVLVNLRRGRLLEQCFALPYSFKMPDLIYWSVLAGREAGSEFAKELTSPGPRGGRVERQGGRKSDTPLAAAPEPDTAGLLRACACGKQAMDTSERRPHAENIGTGSESSMSWRAVGNRPDSQGGNSLCEGSGVQFDCNSGSSQVQLTDRVC